jgi:PDZ domain-containing secreted protein
MRVLVLGGAVMIAVAAFVVELPWGVVHPGTLVPASQLIDVELTPQYLADTGRDDPAVTGEYLAVEHRDRAPLIDLAAAALSPSSVVARSHPIAGVDLLVIAGMRGVGVGPRHADRTDLPLTVRTLADVSGEDLALTLHAFDVGSTQDLAAGRRVLALGRVTDRGVLVCTHPIAAAVRAADAAGADLVLVPSECGDAAAAAVPAGATLPVITAPDLTTAVRRLLS